MKMKKISTIATLLTALLLATNACSQNSTETILSDEDRTGIINAIEAIENRQAEIDAAGTFDEIIADIYDIESTQKAYETWQEFTDFCRNGKYKEAYEFHSTSFNDVYILIYLRHSSNRYDFFSRVMKPLLLNYDRNGLAKYIGILEIEMEMQEDSITYEDEEVTYLPETYPALLMELGTSYMENGQEDDAFSLIRAVDDAFTIQTNRRPVGALLALTFNAELLLMKDNVEAAAECMNIFINFIENNKDEISLEDFEGLKNRAEQIRESIINNHEVR